jgi:hypothetical protein
MRGCSLKPQRAPLDIATQLAGLIHSRLCLDMPFRSTLRSTSLATAA